MQPPDSVYTDTGTLTAAVEAECDPVHETWSVTASIRHSPDPVDVVAVMDTAAASERHALGLRALDPVAGTAEYAATLTIIPTGAYDAGTTTAFSCNDPVQVDVEVTSPGRTR